MSNIITSLVRTWMPIAVGAAATWLATTVDVVLGPDATQAAVVFMTALVSGLYYALARFLEAKFPWAGILLGSPSQPAYTE